MRSRIINKLIEWGFNKKEVSRLTGYKYASVIFYANKDYKQEQQKDFYNPIRNHLFDYLPNLNSSYSFLRPSDTN